MVSKLEEVLSKAVLGMKTFKKKQKPLTTFLKGEDST